MNKIIVILSIIIVLGIFSISWYMKRAPNNLDNQVLILKTNKGDITIELFLSEAPITAGNFLKLADEGFYDGTKFHRVIKNFIIQGGDPNSKTDNTASYGRGGPGYTIKDEFIEGLRNVRGTLSMANVGQQNSGGSQFFINLVDNFSLDFDKQPLSSKHAVFGKVIDGMEVIDDIANSPTDANNIPQEPIVIEQVIRK